MFKAIASFLYSKDCRINVVCDENVKQSGKHINIATGCVEHKDIGKGLRLSIQITQLMPFG